MSISGKPIEFVKLLVASFATWKFHKYGFDLKGNDLSTLANAIASSSGTILGFLITAIALMASVMDRDLLKNLRSTGGYKVLISGSFICAALFLLLLTLSLSLLLPWNSHKDILLLGTVFVAVLAASSLLSTGFGLYRVIISISKK
ncbi:hypothetical protein [Pseudomonas soli]|uniref:Uncharacterized protein n=1 Tax=Pseudomonas soli TaxID=1306993 RepID=A0AAJ5MH60_9PSED|nr:hypothetical protein [Pseudomonas soli]UXZ43575.1 hypothetical protein K7K07_15980 [Pseudomonas soli]